MVPAECWETVDIHDECGQHEKRPWKAMHVTSQGALDSERIDTWLHDVHEHDHRQGSALLPPSCMQPRGAAPRDYLADTPGDDLVILVDTTDAAYLLVDAHWKASQELGEDSDE